MIYEPKTLVLTLDEVLPYAQETMHLHLGAGTGRFREVVLPEDLQDSTDPFVMFMHVNFLLRQQYDLILIDQGAQHVH